LIDKAKTSQLNIEITKLNNLLSNIIKTNNLILQDYQKKLRSSNKDNKTDKHMINYLDFVSSNHLDFKSMTPKEVLQSKRSYYTNKQDAKNALLRGEKLDKYNKLEHKYNDAVRTKLESTINNIFTTINNKTLRNRLILSSNND